MDIYRFIDSRDMREHLQKLNYSFTAPEAAFLVYWCKSATLNEKIAAWREIIDTMPNCAMAGRLNLETIPDFHQFLRDYIDLQERDLRRFKEPDGCVYVCELSRRGELCGDMEFGPFSDFDRCLSAAIRRAAEEETVGLRIFKRPMDPGEDLTWDDYCILTLQGEVCQLDCRAISDRDLDLSLAFDGMWFDFPTPFHAGDIVCSHRRPDEPFVLTDLCTWDAETLRRELPRFGILRQMAQQPGPHTGKNACQRRCQRHDLQWIHRVRRSGRGHTVCVSRSSSQQLFGSGILPRAAEGHPQTAETHQQISQGRPQH